jgi:mitogen-activated protein kinase kinase kinase 7
LGQGTYGAVKRGFWKGDWYAIKFYKTIMKPVDYKRELRLLSRVSHPNIVKMYGAIDSPRGLVMEYSQEGCLHDGIGFILSLMLSHYEFLLSSA